MVCDYWIETIVNGGNNYVYYLVVNWVMKWYCKYETISFSHQCYMVGLMELYRISYLCHTINLVGPDFR